MESCDHQTWVSLELMTGGGMGRSETARPDRTLREPHAQNHDGSLHGLWGPLAVRESRRPAGRPQAAQRDQAVDP
jgi:hypothetical protein